MMPKQVKKEGWKLDWSSWLIVAALTFTTATSIFFIVKQNQDQDLLCGIKAVDQATGLVLLQCSR